MGWLDKLMETFRPEGGAGMDLWVVAIVAVVFLLGFTAMVLASRYKRCPSDAILVIFGRVGKEQSARCIHGGGAMIWPLIQDYKFLSLIPMTINIPLKNALSLQNIRIHVPSTFTVGISTDDKVMYNAAERLLGLQPTQIEDMAREIIFGQLRLTVASLTIEQINQDRESFLTSIRKNVEPELNKIGLNLINVNITDITDESTYIESIGRKAASEAINTAMVDVAEQDKVGAIGQAQANRERTIRVAENEAEAVKGTKQAEADQRVFVQQQETVAAIGEAEAHRERDIQVATNLAQAEKGRKTAEADQRIFVQQREAEAITGENVAKATIAETNARLAEKQAEAHRAAEIAKRTAEIEIQKTQYKLEQERLRAEEIVRKEMEKIEIEIDAAAEGERRRLIARGEADAVLFRYEAEARGVQQVLEAKAEGYRQLIESCHGDAKSAATMLMIEKLEEIVGRQVEAISKLKIDKITVWDSGSGNANGSTSTANFLSGFIKSLPPLQELAAMAGVELPGYLGRITPDPVGSGNEEASAGEPSSSPRPPQTGETAGGEPKANG